MTPTTPGTDLTADVAVIGAGPAGVAAALRAAELGATVVLLEANRTGGTCVNSGCVPTRVLAKTARLMREVRTAHEYGITTGGSDRLGCDCRARAGDGRPGPAREAR